MILEALLQLETAPVIPLVPQRADTAHKIMGQMLESKALPSGSFFGSECEILLDVHLKSWTAGVKNHADTLLLHHHFGTSLDKVTLLHGSRKHSQITVGNCACCQYGQGF